eukprot:TRINITY_DN24371_c0_g1_i1.p1 TRINITY_DN24371_c0_g1~~TRINITY_DN24371_c0_g1_i1.p1  ORF type:complete len:164 (+),score=38.46 TRINITY_DN24371_c0_g1_i1:60-551(+)
MSSDEEVAQRLTRLYVEVPSFNDSRSLLNCLEHLIKEYRSREASSKTDTSSLAGLGGATDWAWEGGDDELRDDPPLLMGTAVLTAAQRQRVDELRDEVRQCDQEIERLQREVHLAAWEAGHGQGPDGGPSLDETVEFLATLRQKVRQAPELLPELDTEAQGKG